MYFIQRVSFPIANTSRNLVIVAKRKGDKVVLFMHHIQVVFLMLFISAIEKGEYVRYFGNTAQLQFV